MRLCYVALLHHKFDQAARLIRRLDAPGVHVVIHIDRKVSPDTAESFRAGLAPTMGSRVSYARRVDARWGSYRQAMAILSGAQCAVECGGAFDRCLLLSGQDYPIASHADIVAWLGAHPAQEFIEAHALDLTDADAPGWSPHFRFRRYHAWLGNRRVAVPLLRKPVPRLTLFHGATWWALSRDAIEHVVRSFRSDTALRRFLRTGFLVDEVYVPTLLMNSRFAERVANANLTFADWGFATAAHPKTLSLANLDALVASEKLFARKFDMSTDAVVMDRLDRLHA